MYIHILRIATPILIRFANITGRSDIRTVANQASIAGCKGLSWLLPRQWCHWASNRYESLSKAAIALMLPTSTYHVHMPRLPSENTNVALCESSDVDMLCRLMYPCHTCCHTGGPYGVCLYVQGRQALRIGRSSQVQRCGPGGLAPNVWFR